MRCLRIQGVHVVKSEGCEKGNDVIWMFFLKANIKKLTRKDTLEVSGISK